jgi:hypothetical protein
VRASAERAGGARQQGGAAMDWHELEKMKVSDLRNLAKERTDLEAVSGLQKAELVAKLAETLGIPRPHKLAEGEGKQWLKVRIRELKGQREQALATRNKDEQERVRREIHGLKRKLRKMAHLTH